MLQKIEDFTHKINISGPVEEKIGMELVLESDTVTGIVHLGTMSMQTVKMHLSQISQLKPN